MKRFTFDVLTFVLASLLTLTGCHRNDPAKTVVLYTSVDEPVARPICEAFEKEYHIKVVLKTDAEATKTVGLAERLRAEKDNPQCDVYWGNEPFMTVGLAEEGVLTGYDLPVMKEISPAYKDAGMRWAGVGLRARSLVYHTSVKDPPKSLEDLLRPEFKGKVAIARPTAGTTAGHVAAIYTAWGKEKADAFFRKLRDNEVKLVGGNSVVAQMVGSGQMLVGLTDTDDVESAKADGGQVAGALPDQEGGGTLMLPTTVGLVYGCPHRAAGEELLRYLLSKRVEDQLLAAHFVRWSVRGEAGVKGMDVSYAEVSRNLPAATGSALQILEGRP